MKTVFHIGRRFGVAVLAVVSVFVLMGCSQARSARRAAAQASLVVQTPAPAPSAGEQQVTRVVIINLTDANLAIFRSISGGEVGEPLPLKNVKRGEIASLDVKVPPDGSLILIARGTDLSGKFVGHEELTLPRTGAVSQASVFKVSDGAASVLGGLQLIPGQSIWRIEKLLAPPAPRTP